MVGQVNGDRKKCMECGGKVPDARAGPAYAYPFCYDCLPPPQRLVTFNEGRLMVEPIEEKEAERAGLTELQHALALGERLCKAAAKGDDTYIDMVVSLLRAGEPVENMIGGANLAWARRLIAAEDRE